MSEGHHEFLVDYAHIPEKSMLETSLLALEGPGHHVPIMTGTQGNTRTS